MKKYILIAGVNGAGKSTLYQTLDSLKDMKRVNTDEIVRSFGNWRNTSDVMKAGKIAVKEIEDAFNRFAIYQNGKLITISEEIPIWYKNLL